MPAEQRIIGGGLLIGGIAVVLILLYFFGLGGMSPTEAREALEGEIYPAYARAAERGDYGGMEAKAKEALDILDEGGRAGVVKYLQASASGGSREARRLYDLVEKDIFAKNAEGLFEFGGDWFSPSTHKGLTSLAAAVDRHGKALRTLRRLAKEARTGLELARTGSGLPLALPEANPPPDAGPVLAADIETFRVFGVKGADLAQALATDDPKGRATSARLRWNQTVPGDDLGEELRTVPALADELKAAADAIDAYRESLEGDDAAGKALAQLVARGADQLVLGLPADVKTAFEARGAPDAAKLANALRAEARALAPYRATTPDLGDAFNGEFAK